MLNPKNILIDDRTITDLVLFMKELSEGLIYYGENNQPDGNFSALLATDESFLLAEVSKFSVLDFSAERLKLVKLFDDLNTFKDKSKVFESYIHLTNKMFYKVNSWYLASKKNNLSQKSNAIEAELESAIIYKLSEDFHIYIKLQDNFIKNELVDSQNKINIQEFNSLVWNTKDEDEILNKSIEYNKSEIDNALKKVIIISNHLYEIIYNITLKSEKLLQKAMHENNNHKAHIGLLFSFLKLFQHVQKDINSITEKHLNFYYKRVLKQKRSDPLPLKTFVNIEIDENLEELTVDEDSVLLAGQYKDGNNILFKIDEDVRLNNVKISELMTIFLSRNSMFEFNSRYNLVSSISSKNVASTIQEVRKFNVSNETFSTLGEEQDFLIETERTMNSADVGFIISSPVLKLSRSDRTIELDLFFEIDSIKYLSDLIIDISNNTALNEDEIFNKIFSNAFKISYTAPQGWELVDGFEVFMPEDWTTGKISIVFSLNKLKAAFQEYDPDIHFLELNTIHPALQVKLNQDNFYNPYSFLNNMELSKINIDVSVQNIKQIKAYRDGLDVDTNLDFDIFGPIPKFGSKLYICCEELFNKKINSFGIDWEFTNLPSDDINFTEYYKEYNLGIKNDSFKVKTTMLSDFNYYDHGHEEFIFNLFDVNEREELKKDKAVSFNNLYPFKILPNYSLSSNSLNEFSNDIETGIVKLELIGPKVGFGVEKYPKIYADQMMQKMKSKDQAEQEIKLKEPFVPKASNLKLSYKASTSFIFREADRLENDFEQQNSFYHISPLGVKEVFSSNSISNNTLVHDFKNQGELIIGLESSKYFSNINLLFEIIKSENIDYEFSSDIKWYYSSFDGWNLMEVDNILYDQTINLIRSGVISFRFPLDFSNNKSILNQGTFYIKACSKDKADQFSLIKSIRPNAVSITEIISKNETHNLLSLKPFSIEGFESRLNGVLKVDQALAPTSIKSPENELEYYQRVSQLLRHKKRPITKWDFEKFILNNFNWLSHVRCYNSDEFSTGSNMRILCVKKINASQNIDEIKLSLSEIDEIKQYILSYISPFAVVEIVNPVFEDLWIKCKVVFSNISNGKGIDMLNKDILDFICPWRERDKKAYNIPTKIRKIDIINFIRDREYISFVTGISLIHLKKSSDGSIVAYDSAQLKEDFEFIECGTERSILAPRNNHKFQIITKKEYHAPEPVNFSELVMDKTFLITKKQLQKSIKKINIDTDQSSSPNKKLQFRLKF